MHWLAHWDSIIMSFDQLKLDILLSFSRALVLCSFTSLLPRTLFGTLMIGLGTQAHPYVGVECFAAIIADYPSSPQTRSLANVATARLMVGK